MPSIDEWSWKQFKEKVIDRKRFKNPKRKLAATNRSRDEHTKQFVKRDAPKKTEKILNENEQWMQSFNKKQKNKYSKTKVKSQEEKKCTTPD